MTPKTHKVAICGRTNAGKSTLFNKLSESNKAIISSLPGTTRDLNYAPISWTGKHYEIIDTGGIDIFDEKELESNIKKQIAAAQKAASVILYTVDGHENLSEADKKIIKKLVRKKTNFILVVNKIDSKKIQEKADPNFERLGVEHVAYVSSKNGSGTGDLLDIINKHLPEAKAKELKENVLKLAIVGKPNVGKSSLLNAILGEDKVVVSDIPHTTRDINDIEFAYKNKNYLLIDTAGLRKKAKVGNWKDKRIAHIERQSVRSTLTTIEEADVVFLVLEAQKNVSDQDKKISQLAVNNSKGLIIVINKWDLIEDKTDKTYDEFIKYFHNHLPFLSWAPMIFISAKEKQRVHAILELAQEVHQNQNLEILSQELDQILNLVMKKYKPKQSQTITFGQKKKPLVLESLTQVDKSPPTFILKTPKPKNVPQAMPNIIEKHLREEFEFLGTPIKIIIEESV
ncbi:MAG: ribosome biogenesis GTPase Der [Patescibacteria group bacterium]|nr:ribosome biogenesis GTPase Der [Patescibacteria group bacterium]